MNLSDKERIDRSPTQVSADAMAIFDALRAKGVDITLAYTATERIRGLINERSLEIARLLSNELTARIDSLTREVRTGFAAVQERFEAMDARQERVEQRLDGIDSRLDGVEGRLNGVEGRLDGVEGRLDGVERRLDGVETRYDRVDARFDRVEGRLGNVEVGLASLQGLYESIDKRLDSLASMFRWGLVLVGLAFSVVGVVLTILAMLLGQALQENRLSVRPADGAPIGVESPVRGITSTQEPTARSPETAGDNRDVPAGNDRE